ncbi:hypothetical protein QRY02_44530 [Amycolatopsis sp. DG1A-15b]|nr:hypothetical protein [Amycolatopsis sp. DG1A-15b]WIX88114.1 hypothetical protein QRY02_44530 [Amycolatopsis sp. DG1A-15b]
MTRYDDVRTVFCDSRFSRNLLYPGAPCLIEPGDFSTGEHSILNMDPPGHTRLRRLSAQAFTVRRIAALRPRIQEIADGLLAAMVAHGPPVDLVEAFAFPLPTAVMCELLGVPFAGRERFRQWSRVIVTPMQHAPADIERARRDGAEDMAALVAEKLARPADDFLSALVHARDEDLLCRHPEQLAALRADPALTPGAVEEIMRYDGPVDSSLLRVALEDVTLGGVLVRRGGPGPRRGGEPGRERVPGGCGVRHPPQGCPAAWLRPRHPFLPRCGAGPAGGGDRAAGAGGPAARPGTGGPGGDDHLAAAAVGARPRGGAGDLGGLSRRPDATRCRDLGRESAAGRRRVPVTWVA